MQLHHPLPAIWAGSLLLGLAWSSGGLRAQAASPAGAPPAAAAQAAAAADPIVAEVEGHAIHLSEVGDAIRAMPGGGGANALEVLYPVALRRLIEREALVLRAQQEGVADAPDVRRHAQEAADAVVENAYLHAAGAPVVTEKMLLARYDSEIRGKPGPEEVHARVMLVATEAEARALIDRLAQGADFATLARQASHDASAQDGGDLGFVRRAALGAEVGAVLFALRPGAVASYPVATPAGWFVLQTEARRAGPTPGFAAVHDRLEAECLGDTVGQVVQAALSHLVLRAYDMNGRQPAAPGDAAASDGAPTR
jgi:peptidyl-prolyl cis-trans isomerase C